MIRKSLLPILLGFVFVTSTAPAVAVAAATPEISYVPFPELIERTLGVAGKPVRFDWRHRSQLYFLDVGQPVEYNNFETGRVAASVFFPSSDVSFGFGVAKVSVSSTPSTDAIALMPYRQLGRPGRWEMQAGAFYPVAEGVVTFRQPMLPAAQMVFSLAADVRYLIYPSLFSTSDIKGGLKSMLSTTLSSSQLDTLTNTAPPGMRVDPGKVNLLAGFNLHL
ncbi:hypothetical protein EBR21_10125, partial [bacterium]|nr:hypothetical protein [bacterium]